MAARRRKAAQTRQRPGHHSSRGQRYDRPANLRRQTAFPIRFRIPVGMPIDHLVPATTGKVGWRDYCEQIDPPSSWLYEYERAISNDSGQPLTRVAITPIPCAPYEDLWAASNGLVL